MKNLYTFLLFLISSSFFAQNGQVDTSFGTNGMKKVITNLYGYQSTPNPPSVDKVIFGSTNETVYLTNDMKSRAITVFGSTPTNGFTFPDYVSGWDQTRFNDAVFDTNQLIYIAGSTIKEDNNKAFFAARLKRGTGSNISKWVMDPGFNIDGKLVFDTQETDEEATAIKLAADGKCVITGYSGNKGIIVRYNSEGFLDKTFNQCGFYTFQIGARSKPTSMVIQSDGKVVVAGNSFNGTDTDFFITRVNNDGTLDTGFGVNGVVVKDVGNQNNSINSMAMGSDGALYLAGKTYFLVGASQCPGLYGYNATVFKFDTNGQSVTSFGNGFIPGAYMLPGCYPWGTDRFALESEYNNIVYKEGYIYGVGYQETFNSPYVHGVQLYLNVETPYNGHSFGWSYPNPTTYNVIPISVEIKPSDNTFYSIVKYDNCNVGQTPMVKAPSINFPTTCISSSENSILFKKIVKTSTGYYGLDNTKNLFKMDNNFNLDTTFAENGYLFDIRNFTVDSNDKIICNLGETNAGSTKFVMARYNTNGKPDTSFGFYGTLPITPLLWINGISATPQNEYLFTKTYALSGATKLCLSKITNTGEPVNSFGTGGSIDLASVTITSGSYSLLNAAEDLVKDSAGNYYPLVYHISGGNGPAFIKVFKILPNGTIDTTFGTNGIVDLTTSISLNASYKLNIAINTVNGKLLVYNKNILLQLNLNGSIDTSFGINGIYDANVVLTDFGISRVLVKGSDYYIGGNHVSSGNSIILKINSSGVLDTSFGNNAGYYQETPLSNPSYVQVKDMFLEANSIYFYLNGIKKLN